ncbi:MAG TPA: UDP-N-acetylmuramoyl-L-alanyl-D-glutamate--2,6-diaminopimelate ligase [Clostridiales bacterium]|nr:UDP-N-acetylmuramoyl-L-alanyl-D-glutamate--2,6-diaminopimelate ligase [Clostridiales bacterium]
MIVSNLLKGLNYVVIQGTDDVNVDFISWDSRKVRRGSLFICVKGRNVDRHDFAIQAIEAGASVLVIEHEVGNIPANVNIIKVENTKKTMAHISSVYYGEPSKSINLIGITGTNGKTSVSWFIAKILGESGRKAGIIGTIENRVDTGTMKVEKLNPTTPDSIELQATLREMLDEGVTDVAMEVTSLALLNHRVDQCLFNIGVFTNLTQDHLDEHGTMENYKNAKMKLFKMCRYGVINADIPIYPEIKERASCEKLVSYGINNNADFKAENIEYMIDGVTFTLDFNGVRKDMRINVPGKFNVYNALAAIGTCYLSGLTLEQIASGIEKIESVKGRFESVPNFKGCLVIIDYAHTPDGLENILSSIKEFAKKKVITVFGCGGDRDRTKRSVMGEIAGKWSDFCIITSDNPRTENPMVILEDIESGISKTSCNYEKVLDRKEAIYRALNRAKAEDVVLIARKGHETYQMFANYSIPFDDSEIARRYFDNRDVNCEDKGEIL